MGFKYGEKVIIRDGSSLDGVEGVAYSVKEGRVLVLLDREVFWEVSEQWLEPCRGKNVPAVGLQRAFELGSE